MATKRGRSKKKTKQQLRQGASARQGKARGGSARGRRARGISARMQARRKNGSAGSSPERQAGTRAGRTQETSSSRNGRQAASSRRTTARHQQSTSPRIAPSQNGRSRGSARRSEAPRRRTAQARDPEHSVIAVLRRDHRQLRQLLKEIESAHAASHRDSVLEQIENEIKQHTQLEEEIFYPAYKDAVQNKEDRKLYYEAMEEHHAVDLVLPELRRAVIESERFSAKAKVLKDIVEHHIREEETEMFPRARTHMSEPELVQLGEEIEDRKQQLGSSWNPLKAVTALVSGE